MKLSHMNLMHKLSGISYPKYDVNRVTCDTKQNPIWVHFGAGNIFRGYIARLQDDLLNKGLTNKGIIACETFDYEIIEKIYKPYDSLTLLATLSATKPTEYKVVASVSEGIAANLSVETSKSRLKEIFENPSLQFVSFTVTEKGYSLRGLDGKYLPVVAQDIEEGPNAPKHVMSIVCSLLLNRFNKNQAPIAVVSMDNCSHNGEKLQNAVLDIAKNWKQKGFVTDEFINYLSDESKVTFPWSMIDKITPRPANEIKEEIEKLGFTEMDPITTEKRTFIAPFVNAEVCEYLVIEDKFPNGRPKLEEVGVYFTSRETVNKVETMKVTTCLNPLHTALAVYGCTLGYTSIANEMESIELVNLIRNIGSEGMKVVVDPVIISPQKFLDEVLFERLPNKSIPDTPQRIATDTSQKIAVRFGETIKAYKNSENLNPQDLKYIPLALAGWCRYLLGINDNLETFELSADPMLQDLKEILKDVSINNYNGELKYILSNKQIFGINLYEVGLAGKVENYFKEMITGKGAVLATLRKYL